MYNLKKAWISLLLLSIPASIISIIFLFIFNEGFETKNFIYSFFLFFSISYYNIKEFVIDNSVKIKDAGYRGLSHSIKFKILYRQTSNLFFEKKKPFLSLKVLFLISDIFKVIITSVVVCYVFYSFFYSLSEYSLTNIIRALFYSFINIVLFIFFIKYFIYKLVSMLFFLFIEPFCYEFKKEFNNHKVYLKNNNSLHFYKNSKLHCDFLPAYIKIGTYHSHISVESVDNDSTNKYLKRFLDDCYNNRTKEEWYLNNEKINIDKNLSLEKKQKIIKLIQNSKNF